MKVFIALSALLALANAGVIVKPIQQSGPLSGPIHPAFGDLVSTKRGLRPLSLEGFSEDDNQDGFVDNVAQAVPVAAAPVVYHAPAIVPHATPFVHAPVVKTITPAEPVKVEAPTVKVEAPLVYHHAPLTYTSVHPVAPHVTTYTHALPLTAHHVVGAPFLPTVVKAEEAKEVETE